MSVIDYSKWDSLDAGEEEVRRRPVITRLDKPTSVTIPGRGAAAAKTPCAAKKPKDALDYSRWDSLDAGSDDEALNYFEDDWHRQREEELQAKAGAEAAAAPLLPSAAKRPAVAVAAKSSAAPLPAAPAAPQELQAAATEAAESSAAPLPAASAAARERGRLSERGADAGAHLWRQSADTAEVFVVVPRGARARLVAVELSKGRLCVAYDGAVVLEGELAHAVWGGGDRGVGATVELTASEEQLETNTMEWDVRDLMGDPAGRRCVCVAMTKRPPSAALRCWWSRLLVRDGEQVDVARLQGRKAQGGMQQAWVEAQAAFRKKVAALEPVEVECE